MNTESCDSSTIQDSNPHLSEGPDAEATLSKEAPTMSSTESEDVVHLDNVDQETMKINLDTNFVSKSESFADESSSTNSSTILLSDGANNGETAEAEVLCGSLPSAPADGRAYSNNSRYNKGGWNSYRKYAGQYMQAACQKGVPAHLDILKRAGPVVVPCTRRYNSGTDSSMQDDSDAPPPPDAVPLGEGCLADDTIADDLERQDMRSACQDKLLVKSEEPVNPARVGPLFLFPERLPKHSPTELASSPSAPIAQSRDRYQAYVEEVMDEDLLI